MNKKYIITGAIGLGLGVGAWFFYRWYKHRNDEVIKDGSFTINVSNE